MSVCLDAMLPDVDAQHEKTSTNEVLAVFLLHYYTASIHNKLRVVFLFNFYYAIAPVQHYGKIYLKIYLLSSSGLWRYCSSKNTPEGDTDTISIIILKQ